MNNAEALTVHGLQERIRELEAERDEWRNRATNALIAWRESRSPDELRVERDAAIVRAESVKSIAAESQVEAKRCLDMLDDLSVAIAGKKEVPIKDLKSALRDRDAQLAAMREMLTEYGYRADMTMAEWDKVNAALASDAGKPLLAWIDRATKALEPFGAVSKLYGTCHEADKLAYMRLDECHRAAEVLKDKP